MKVTVEAEDSSKKERGRERERVTLRVALGPDFGGQ